jgi:hypothetical protein
MRLAKKHGYFLILLLLGLITRVVFLSYHGLSNDELSAWYRTGFSSWDDFWYFGVTHGDMHPVFYQVLLWCWVRLFGDADWIIRVPSLFFYIGNMFLIYGICRKYFSEKAAYLPLLIYIGSSFLIIHTTLARPYNSGSFFILFSFLGILELNEKKDRSWRWIFFLSLGLSGAMLSHYFAFLTAGVLGLLGLIILNSKKRWDVVIAGALACVYFLPHLSVTWYQLNRGGLQWLAAPSWDWLMDVGVQLLNNSVWLALLFLSVIVYSLINKRIKSSHPIAFRMAWLIVLLTLVFGYLISYLLTPVLRELVVLFILPFLLIVLGHQIQLSKTVTILGAFVLLLHSFMFDSVLKFHHFGDFKFLAADINKIHDKTGFSSITHATNTNNAAYLNYYLKNDVNEDIKNWDEPEAVNKLFARVQRIKTTYFLYALNNAYHSEQFIAVIRSRYPVVFKDASFGNSRYVFFKKSNKQLRPNTVQQMQVSEEEFLATVTWPVDQFNSGSSVFLTNHSIVEGNEPVYGVVTIERDEKQLLNGNSPVLYQSFDVNQKFNGNKDLGTAYLGFKLPVACLPTDSIKCYLWNPTKLKISTGKWIVGHL